MTTTQTEIIRIGRNGYCCEASQLHRIHQHYEFAGIIGDGDDQLAEFTLVTEIDGQR